MKLLKIYLYTSCKNLNVTFGVFEEGKEVKKFSCKNLNVAHISTLNAFKEGREAKHFFAKISMWHSFTQTPPTVSE